MRAITMPRLRWTTAVASCQTLTCMTVGARATSQMPPECAAAIARRMPIWTASATTSTIASGRLTFAAFATGQARYTSAAARASSPTLSVNAVALARRTKTKTACATTWTTASGSTILVASATDLAPCTNADAQTSQPGIAIAKAKSKTPWAHAVGIVQRTWTATAFATTKTRASAKSTNAGNATDQVLSWNAGATKSKKANATAKAMLKTPWACAEAIVPKTWTAMASATMTMHVSASWTNVANATALAPSSSADATKSQTAIATARATSRTSLANAAGIAPPMWTTTAFATWTTTASAPSTRAGCATAPARCTSAVATTSRTENAIASEAKRTPSGCAEAGATSTWTLTASATTKMLALAPWMPAAFATALAPFTPADASSFPRATAIAMETNWTPSATVAARVRRTSTTMVSATTSTVAWARWIPAGCATVLASCTNAGAKTCLKEIAIATETKWMPWAFALARATRMWMATGCATTWTPASAHLTLAAFATGLDRSTNADVMTFLRAIAIAMETKLTPSVCAAVHAMLTSMEMAFATTWTTALGRSTHVAFAMDQGQSWNAAATT